MLVREGYYYIAAERVFGPMKLRVGGAFVDNTLFGEHVWWDQMGQAFSDNGRLPENSVLNLLAEVPTIKGWFPIGEYRRPREGETWLAAMTTHRACDFLIDGSYSENGRRDNLFDSKRVIMEQFMIGVGEKVKTNGSIANDIWEMI